MSSLRNLIALYISVILLPIALLIFIYSSNLDIDYGLLSDEIALNELREVMLISYDLKISDKRLEFLYQGEDYSLSLVNGKLLLQPGTLIYLNDIDDLYFYINNNSIYIKYLRKGKEYERNLLKKESFYIDDFSNCDDELPDDDNSDEQLPIPLQQDI